MKDKLPANKDFTDCLRTLRHRSGVTAEEVALKTGVSRAYVNHWERGTRPIPERYLLPFLDAVNASIEDRKTIFQFCGVEYSEVIYNNVEEVALEVIDSQFESLVALHREMGARLEILGQQIEIFKYRRNVSDGVSNITTSFQDTVKE